MSEAAVFPDQVLYPSLAVVLTLATSLWAGVGSVALAARLRVPLVVVLLLVGVALGPEGLGWLRPSSLGREGLRSLVSVAVAIVVFEGAMAMDWRRLRPMWATLVGLLTLTPLLTALGAGWACHVLMGLDGPVAALYGSIVAVTGPTVVNPILRRLRINPSLKVVLEAESVFVDAVGVLLAASVFSFITSAEPHWEDAVARLFRHLLTGLCIGGGVAMATLGLLRSSKRPAGAEVQMMVLATALGAYALSERVAHESGIASVALAGLILAGSEFPGKRSVADFKRGLTLISLVVVFLLLASSQRLDLLLSLGWEALAVVAFLMVVVRPSAVAVATIGAGFRWPERLFMGWLGPRGIVAASLASYMAIELAAWGVDGGEQLRGLVFLTVLVTVTVQGGFAPMIARRLALMPQPVLVIGGDRLARWIARHLHRQGEAVVLLERDELLAEPDVEETLQRERADVADPAVLARWLALRPTCLVVATPSDKSNLHLAQQARQAMPRLRIVARQSSPLYREAYEALRLEVLETDEAAGLALAGKVARPSLIGLLASPPAAQGVLELQLGRMHEGKRLKELGLQPEGLAILIRRGDKVIVPAGDTVMAAGDQLTLLGKQAALEQLRGRLADAAGA